MVHEPLAAVLDQLPAGRCDALLRLRLGAPQARSRTGEELFFGGGRRLRVLAVVPLILRLFVPLILRLFGDFARFAGFLDDEVVPVSLDDTFDPWVLVAGEDEEQAAVAAHASVGLRVD